MTRFTFLALVCFLATSCRNPFAPGGVFHRDAGNQSAGASVDPGTGSITIEIVICPGKDSIRAGLAHPACAHWLDSASWRR